MGSSSDFVLSRWQAAAVWLPNNKKRFGFLQSALPREIEVVLWGRGGDVIILLSESKVVPVVVDKLHFWLLMWEDGYFDTMKVQDSMEDLFAETMFRNLVETSSHNTYNGTSGGDVVEVAFVYMSTFQYALGEGVFGDVAYIRNSHWIYANHESPGETLRFLR
ncbi:unnamed protein product [Lactuca virosa]|uniref:Transcription factor MYC/MYB N-terminal domain-containing protein n=1 Tax=Lactuca virosa TaxID=75947 RepID=A0AAU9P325_9ASTR|nr:unnamed protein product [Lactuca virosa]